ncbi:hypothetical protein BD770DRAFT_439297 [Pilaira anomala]|nr:hypothetical protein BD770DRAFT_439297 [Pilaira anomala]
MDRTEEQLKVIQQKDALAFLDEIRSEFPNDNNKVFQEFIKIMADFKSNEIGTKQVLERTTQLFSGHRTLIQQFVQFLPPGHVLQKTTDLQDSTCIEIKTPSGDLIIVDSTRGIVES